MRLNLQAVWWMASLKRPPNAVAAPCRAVCDGRRVPEAPSEARRLTRDGFRGSGKSSVVPLRPPVGTQYAAEQTILPRAEPGVFGGHGHKGRARARQLVQLGGVASLQLREHLRDCRPTELRIGPRR